VSAFTGGGVGGSASRRELPPLATTGIGSLPHTQLELAVQQAFQVDIPYLPQLPRDRPAEFMVPQALDGLPGLRWDAEGQCQVVLSEWRRGAPALDRRLERALAGNGLEEFEPSPSASLAWRPFLWELRERGTPFAKAQIAGPLTCCWALTADDGRPAADHPELTTQCFRLILARAMAMAGRLREAGAEPLVFFDEPGLWSLDLTNPQHLVGLQELRIAALALKQTGARVGVHCCGDTRWASLLAIGWDYLSIDVHLSLDKVLANRDAVGGYLGSGGRFALGIIPTDLKSAEVPAEEMVAETVAALGRIGPVDAGTVLRQCLLTPACGMALRSVVDCEETFARLKRAQGILGVHLRAA
jgi:hypothetical protein